MRYFLYFVLILMTGAAVGVGIAGFQGRLSRRPPLEVFPDMDRQLKLRPMQPNSFFSNGVSSQLPPPGTVARRQPLSTLAGPVYPFEDAPANTGRIAGATNFIETNPLPVTGQLLRRGRERFDIYCAPCHGALGDGNGITKKLGVMPTAASLQDKRIVEMADGEIFNTITHGKNTMAAYGPILPVADRWAVIAYLRALQLSQSGAVDDLPPDRRDALNQSTNSAKTVKLPEAGQSKVTTPAGQSSAGSSPSPTPGERGMSKNDAPPFHEAQVGRAVLCAPRTRQDKSGSEGGAHGVTRPTLPRFMVPMHDPEIVKAPRDAVSVHGFHARFFFSGNSLPGPLLHFAEERELNFVRHSSWLLAGLSKPS
jgi:mono/diheme cytochrome c family protein